jgi:3'-phosphoadenosine 5'-phosphosulfate sulfotransferase (PAPS reductase)/FAD synthetase
MKERKTYNVLSLGCGTQSSAMYVMAAKGDLSIDVAIFADTQNEPTEVYRYFNILKEKYSDKVPIIKASKGNLAETTLNNLTLGKRFPFPPLWMRKINRKGEEVVVLLKQRQCTVEYKIKVVRAAAREYFGGNQRGVPKYNLNMLLGITTDEFMRMKDSPLKYITHKYPLIDRHMTRDDCIDYLNDAGLPPPPKSACYQCGFKSSKLWRHLRDTDPERFKMAVEFDSSLRKTDHPMIKSLQGPVFLHHIGLPLTEAVQKEDTIDMFGMACDSLHCGI